MRANFATFANALYHLNATPLSVAVLALCAWGENLVARQIQLGKRGEMGGACGRSKHSKNGAVFGRRTSLSLSLSLVARTFWHTKIFKRFIFGILRPFCHFEPLQKGDPTGCKAQAAAKKSTQIKRKLAIFGYFADAQYDSKRVIASRFCENGVAIHKFSVAFALWIATLALLARKDDKTKIQIFHSKFKAFHKFNSFYNFISNFKPYTRLFHIFTPNFLYFHSNRFQNFEKFNTRSSL